MTAWEYLNLKGVGSTALAILLSGLIASNTFDALVQKSTAPNGSTAWVHLISALSEVQVPGGGADDDYVKWKRGDLIARQDEEILAIIVAFLEANT